MGRLWGFFDRLSRFRAVCRGSVTDCREFEPIVDISGRLSGFYGRLSGFPADIQDSVIDCQYYWADYRASVTDCRDFGPF